MTIELTPSELMALRDIVAHYLLVPDHSEVFVDVLRCVETTPEDLLARLMGLAGRLEHPERRQGVEPSTGRRITVTHRCDEWRVDGVCQMCFPPRLEHFLRRDR